MNSFYCERILQQGKEKEGDGGGGSGGVDGIGWRRWRRKRGLKGVETASREDGVHLRAGKVGQSTIEGFISLGSFVAKFLPKTSTDTSETGYKVTGYKVKSLKK